MGKTPTYEAILLSPPVFITATNQSGLKKLYPLFKDKNSDAQLLQCETCGSFFQLPGNRSLIKLEKHIASKRCSRMKSKKAKWRLETQIRAEATAALETSGLQHNRPAALTRIEKRVSRVLDQPQPQPVVQAQSLINSASGTISFSVPLNPRSYGVKYPGFERVFRLNTVTLVPPPPEREVCRVADPSTPPNTPPPGPPGLFTTQLMAGATPFGLQPLEGGSHSRPSSNDRQGSPDTELSSDSESESEECDEPRRYRVVTVQERELDISDTEVEDIRRRINAHSKRRNAT
ncbi:hypothetical protein DFP72DRAFT_1131699 [Ephemerocybe angulata]|uniref:Uncharacterized protein n=1 Tax=Ephemerocybe angulata TaxID=980116 RepID=A0A8H6HV21_9AGAR|nr:hypothetical protein DFP72DRAFT_1131699 [Tulosesus angulatus]